MWWGKGSIMASLWKYYYSSSLVSTAAKCMVLPPKSAMSWSVRHAGQWTSCAGKALSKHLSMGMARVLKVDSDSIYGSNFEFEQLQSQEYELEPTGWIKGIGHCRYNVFQQLRISHWSFHKAFIGLPPAWSNTFLRIMIVWSGTFMHAWLCYRLRERNSPKGDLFH